MADRVALHMTASPIAHPTEFTWMLLLDIALVFIGCYALYRGGDWLIDGVKGIGADLGWSPALIGLLLVSIGTSAPELFVSVGAAIQGYGGIAVGNAVGSNIVNLGIVLGIGAVIVALPVSQEIAYRHTPVMLLLTLLTVGLLFDGSLSRIEAVILMVLAAAALTWAIKGTGLPEIDNAESEADKEHTLPRDLRNTLLGVVALAIGAEALITGGSGLASAFGVSDAVIALTVTSIGTGLPEIVATVLAVARREVEMAIANIVGSNIMNLGLVLGVSGVIVPLDASGIGMGTLLYLTVLSVLLLILGLKPARVARPVGAALLLSYMAYVVWLVS